MRSWINANSDWTDHRRERPGRERRITEAFVELADTLVDDYDVIDLLDHLVAHCMRLLAADAAGILLADPGGELRAVSASIENAQMMELLQQQAEEGPCVEAFRTAAQVRVADVSTVTDRWPRFVATVAGGATFASMHAVPMRLRGNAIGVLNLFHRTPGPMSDSDLALGQALADVATIGILQERAVRHGHDTIEHLRVALDNRVIIEQAKGVLAQYHSVSTTAAFDLLRTYARTRDELLVDVARRSVAGEIDLSTLRNS